LTIEQLIQCDAATLEKMTDQELLEHFKQYLATTRPEQAVKQQRTTSQQSAILKNPKFAKGMSIAKELGIDIDPSLLTYRKR
jgi:hypothetical protein